VTFSKQQDELVEILEFLDRPYLLKTFCTGLATTRPRSRVLPVRVAVEHTPHGFHAKLLAIFQEIDSPHLVGVESGRKGWRSLRRMRRCFATFLLAVAKAAVAETRAFPHNASIFSPASTPAHSIYRLSLFVLAICIAIFIPVSGGIIFAIVKVRRRSNDDGREPAQIYGSNQLELAWTVIPVLVVVVLFLASARVIHSVEDARFPPNTTEVIAVGHQFWWEFQYPQRRFITANELHVPVSDADDPHPTHITLLSADTDQ
jgi:hypothetical protein